MLRPGAGYRPAGLPGLLPASTGRRGDGSGQRRCAVWLMRAGGRRPLVARRRILGLALMRLAMRMLALLGRTLLGLAGLGLVLLGLVLRGFLRKAEILGMARCTLVTWGPVPMTGTPGSGLWHSTASFASPILTACISPNNGRSTGRNKPSRAEKPRPL